LFKLLRNLFQKYPSTLPNFSFRSPKKKEPEERRNKKKIENISLIQLILSPQTSPPLLQYQSPEDEKKNEEDVKKRTQKNFIRVPPVELNFGPCERKRKG
jgi:hypothetical protein